MMKNIFGGMVIGIANIIPGVSGGTMMVILGLFDPLMAAISNVFRRKNDERMKDIYFIFQIIFGAGIGLVIFGNIVKILFEYIPTQTLWCFIGLILFSVPSVLKSELKGGKLNYLSLLIGFIIVLGICLLNPDKIEGMTVDVFPEITVMYLLLMVVVGMISGATMLLPGVSGSMVLLVIGQYYIFISYVANVLTFEWNILIPLAFIACGIALGIFISAKLMSHFLEERRELTISFIIGMIIASIVSILTLIPLASYTWMTTTTSILALIIGAGTIILLEMKK